ncbi:hypothetical protein Tco_0204107 [Tanacetum coccineum]
MIVQPVEEMDEDSDHLTDSTPIHIIDQPSSSSQPKKKQPSKKAQRQEAEHEESVLTPSNDLQPSVRSALQLTGFDGLIDLEVRKRKISRPYRFEKTEESGMSRRVESSEDQESLGAPEDASKQGRSIEDINADVDVSLVDETQERQDDDLMFDTRVLEDDEMHVEAKVDGKDDIREVDEVDEAELKKLLVIKKDEDIAIDAIPLATKSRPDDFIIVEYKLLKEGIMVHYQLIRADGSSKRYSSMIRMLQDIDREDLETLWKLVKTKHGDTRPEDEHERVLLGDLKVMFEPDIRSEVWRNLQGSSSETIDQTFDRLQKLITQLEIQGEVITQEDMNLKLLRSLPSEWKTHALIWRNKQEIKTISLDDLYNNLKIYESEISVSSSISQNPQNVAFVSSNSTNSNSSTNEADNTTYGVISPNSLNLLRGSRTRIDPDDLEGNGFQWEMVIAEIRLGDFIHEDRRDVGCLESVEARLAHYKKIEVVFEENINVLKLEVKLRDTALVENKKKLEKAEKERDELKLTLEKF